MKRAAVILITLTVLLSVLVGCGSASIKRGVVAIQIAGDSMQPTFYAGAYAYIDTTIPFKNVKIGDIIAYKVGQDINIHRLISISDGYITTQGDNNAKADEPVQISAYYGKLIEIKTPDGRTLKP